ncbi:Outer membrane lipoprotein-sorting protein [Mycobacteroides abscessus subsp. abscessus]|nr:Outer membrane lipoprotein-sorting protein [Mycobacteroides abscessus subsp. abscessus]
MGSMLINSLIKILLVNYLGFEEGEVYPITNEVAANEITQLEEIKGKTDFKLIIPTDIPKDWVLEIKEPTEITENVQLVRLNYLDKTDTYLKVSITESKSNGKLDDFGEKLNIEGTQALFQKLTPTERYKDVTGGTLMWIQDDTLVSIFSSRLPKSELIKISESMISSK